MGITDNYFFHNVGVERNQSMILTIIDWKKRANQVFNKHDEQSKFMCDFIL